MATINSYKLYNFDTITRNQGGKTSNSRPTVAKEARPIRTKKPPSKYQDHILYKWLLVAISSCFYFCISIRLWLNHSLLLWFAEIFHKILLSKRYICCIALSARVWMNSIKNLSLLIFTFSWGGLAQSLKLSTNILVLSLCWILPPFMCSRPLPPDLVADLTRQVATLTNTNVALVCSQWLLMMMIFLLW